MQKSAEINANCVFILIQEKSSSKLHFPCIPDSNCAQSTCPGQGGTHGQELVVFSSCKVPTPSSLSSCLVIQPDHTGPQPNSWQGQNLLLQDSFSGSCYWLNILWVFHVFSWWEKTFSDFSCWLWKAKIQLLVVTQHHSFLWNCHPSKPWLWIWWDQWNKNRMSSQQVRLWESIPLSGCALTLQHCSLPFRQKHLFFHTTHEPHILLDSSVRAEPHFTAKDLLCDPASCTATPAASGPGSALCNWQVPHSPCAMLSPRCHHQSCRDRKGTSHGSTPWSQSLIPKGERISFSCVWTRNETWTLPVLCPGSGPCHGQRFRPSVWLSPSASVVPFVLLCSSSLCIFPVLDFETIYDRRQEKLAQ